MYEFSYERAAEAHEAVNSLLSTPNARFIAGGTNLLDLMKGHVERPDHLIDVSRLQFEQITDLPDGGLRLGAMATNAHTAWHDKVEKRYPLISEAILAGASPQLRNKATNGGNLMQRTRCYYFYDLATPCNKREPGSGCSAIGGFNRIHAILGASDQCIATHPSDLCVALLALDARVNVIGAAGERIIAFPDFHRLPGDTPQIDNNLLPGELITEIDLPPVSQNTTSHYLKIRDRQSYAFALVSVAAVLELEGGRISDVRIALGGVAHKPWRDTEAEQLLIGQLPTPGNFELLATRILKDAAGYRDNAFKIELAKRAIVMALGTTLEKSQK
ncbi:MAG: Periplasmic aromatic aldehyde oxidoreductase, FAD binding subunit YagS [uncultured Adhaeribacter sp.]|uniref:Periplasmic aromatic aldehyde oxidoreductase, FAD binding subunit YagS n=1 Tax=uncultured Adhaeribacter sp. TaxID=448109 RepID=A0A6J4JYY5_9BACT|nr:MAG: Periplasmic aromatic aldehyde oxidoreductase, FAD binding subunit YagS [uncultured Adhaeribacter sp.]